MTGKSMIRSLAAGASPSVSRAGTGCGWRIGCATSCSCERGLAAAPCGCTCGSVSPRSRIATSPMTEFTGASLFEGFPRETFTWFGGLEADNSKAYFAAHRGTYEEVVRGALQAMLDELADELGGH